MDVEALLRDLIHFRTINDPANGIRPEPAILDYIRILVQEWEVKLQAQIFEDHSYSSLYFAIDPNNKVDILFMGHLDVVPVSKGWKSDPFVLRVESGLAYGRGVKDCKGSVVSALLMLEKLSVEKNPLLERIGFFLSMDEESGGHYGAQKFLNNLKKNNILPQYVINVDGGPRVVYKRRAGFGVKLSLPAKILKTKGRGQLKSQKCQTRIVGDANRHSAYFVRGSDTHALVSLSKLLHLNRNWRVNNIFGSWVKGNVIPDDIEAKIVVPSNVSDSTLVTYDENLTSVLRKIRSLILIDIQTDIISEFGISVNPNLVSYSSAGTEIYFDVRAFLSSDKTENLINAFKQRLEELVTEATITCSGTSGYFYTSKDSPLVNISAQVLEEYSLPSDACEQEGASDSRYVSAYQIPVIDLGPRGGNIHGTDEYIDLESMKEFASIYEEIVSRLLTP